MKTLKFQPSGGEMVAVASRVSSHDWGENDTHVHHLLIFGALRLWIYCKFVPNSPLGSQNTKDWCKTAPIKQKQ
ncbi:TPA: hypothetical protein ACQTXI_005284 [Pseudomonas aeruginosa]